jgi:hypothetical protein
LNAYKEVRDADGYYLEHAYMDAILEKKIKKYISTVPLDLGGVSGSSGLECRATVIQKLIKYIKLYVLKLFTIHSQLFV